MATNHEVIREFFFGIDLSTSNLKSVTAKDGKNGEFNLHGATALYSYDTIIAVAYKKLLFIDKTKYTCTSSRHINQVLGFNGARFRNIIEVDGIYWDASLYDLFEDGGVKIIDNLLDTQKLYKNTKNEVKKSEYIKKCSELEHKLDWLLDLAGQYICKQDLSDFFTIAKKELESFKNVDKTIDI